MFWAGSSFFMLDQKFVYILWQSQTFCARQKDDLNSVKFFFCSSTKVFEEALNAVKFLDQHKTFPLSPLHCSNIILWAHFLFLLLLMISSFKHLLKRPIFDNFFSIQERRIWLNTELIWSGTFAILNTQPLWFWDRIGSSLSYPT